MPSTKKAQLHKYYFEQVYATWVTLWASLNERQAENVRWVPEVARFIDHARTKDCWTVYFDPRFDKELMQDNIIRAMEGDEI